PCCGSPGARVPAQGRSLEDQRPAQSADLFVEPGVRDRRPPAEAAPDRRARPRAVGLTRVSSRPLRRFDSRPVTVLLLGALMVLGLALRVRHIEQLDFWYDEMALWLYSLSGVPATPLEPPLMSWVL